MPLSVCLSPSFCACLRQRNSWQQCVNVPSALACNATVACSSVVLATDSHSLQGEEHSRFGISCSYFPLPLDEPFCFALGTLGKHSENRWANSLAHALQRVWQPVAASCQLPLVSCELIKWRLCVWGIARSRAGAEAEAGAGAGLPHFERTKNAAAAAPRSLLCRQMCKERDRPRVRTMAH